MIVIVAGDGVDLSDLPKKLDGLEPGITTDANDDSANYLIVDCPARIESLNQDKFEQTWLIGKCGALTGHTDVEIDDGSDYICLLYTSPSPRDS